MCVIGCDDNRDVGPVGPSGTRRTDWLLSIVATSRAARIAPCGDGISDWMNALILKAGLIFVSGEEQRQ